MRFLPIVERELRAATRARLTHWSRVAVGGVAVAITVWMLGTLDAWVTPDLLGARFFRVLTHLGWFACLFPGVLLTADCLSQEKREGTLGLLFLTDLKGYDVVLGKLAATSLRAFNWLLVGFPFLAISFFIGGVTLGEFWRTVAVLGNTLLFSLTTGMVVSALVRREHVAVFLTLAIILGLTFAAPILGPAWGLFSPLTSFQAATAEAYAGSALRYLAGLGCVQGLSWLFLALASHVAPHCWQEKPLPGQAANGGTGERVLEQRTGLRAAPSDRCDDRPAEWLARRQQSTRWIWATLAVVVATWYAGGNGWGGPGWNPTAIYTVGFSLHAVVLFWIAWEAARRLNGARRSGILEQLASTPVRPDEIVNGQMRSLERQFAPPLLVIAAFDVLLLLAGRHGFQWSQREMFHYGMLTSGMLMVMFVSAYTLARVGLCSGLRHRSVTLAALMSLFKVVQVPTAFFLLLMFFVLAAAGRAMVDMLAGVTVFWTGITIVCAFVFHSRADHQLATRFREWSALVPDELRQPRSAAADTRTLTEDYGLA